MTPSSSRLSALSLQAATMGVLVAIIGFTRTFAVVLQGLRTAGASEAEAASGLMALCIAMGLSGIWLAWTRRMPISVAWSTPGAALLISSGKAIDGFDAVVGAFVVRGILLVVAGAFRPLGRLSAALCAGNDASPEPARRYWAAIEAGGMPVVFGLVAGTGKSTMTNHPETQR